MKKNSIIISIIGIILIAIIVSVVNSKRDDISSNEYLATKNEERTFVSHRNINYTDKGISFDFKEFDGKWSFFDITLEQGADVSIEDDSDICKGKLYLVVLDEDYNLVSKKEINGEGKLEFHGKSGDKYLLRIVGKKASGHFSMKVSSNNEFNLRYRDFFKE